MGPSGTSRGRSQIANRQSPIRIGTRASKLALTQAQWAADALVAAHPGLACTLVHITTSGDRQRTQPLPAIGGKGLFTKELEEALLGGEIDLAVHSLKDLPTRLPAGLAVAAVPRRAPANDALIIAQCAVRNAECRAKTRHEESRIFALPRGARVGTSSPRREAQLRQARPDLCIVPMRGNLDTRLRKLAEGQCEAIVVACAGLVRLGLAAPEGQVASGEWRTREPAGMIVEALSFELMLPAPGQGALAIEARAGSEAAALAAAIADPAATAATAAERALLDALGGGCAMPLGAYAELAGQELRLRAILLSPDGSRAVRADRCGPAADPVGLASAVAQALR